MTKELRKPLSGSDPSDDTPELLLGSSEPSSDMYSLVTDEAVQRRQITLVKMIDETSFELIKNLYDAIVEDTLVDGKLPEDPDPIHVVCGTPGGDLNSMLGIMNLFLYSEIPIYTYVLSQTSSAGALIYLSGEKRFAPRNGLASVMLHPTSWDGAGQRESHVAFHTFIKKIEKSLTELVQSRTKIPKKLLTELSVSKTHYFVGEELFKYKIATDEYTSSMFWNINSSPKED